MQHEKEVCNFDFPSFKDFLPKQKVEFEEHESLQEDSHSGKCDIFQSSFDFFDELPAFVSEEEDEVHDEKEENQDFLMLNLE